jgi:prepilin-type N-terminal cleavage/methylation domain-containing protein
MRAECSTSQDGFTLLEAVVALAVVAMVVIGYLGMRTSALIDGIEARNWRLARELAEERMSELIAGARETPPQSGIEEKFEQYEGFSYQIVVGESSIGELESSIASDAAEEDTDSRSRAEWQQNRDTYRKASSRGLSALEYQDQLAAEEYQRRVDNKAPSETEFEQVAVAVFFPKLNARFEGQRESFLIKAKVSTLALSGMTPDQAKQIADAQGTGTDPTAGGGLGGGAMPSGTGGGSSGGGSLAPAAGGGK